MPFPSDELIEIKDVKTTSDLNRLMLQNCTAAGLETSLFSYIGGMIGIPFLLRKSHHRIPLSNEYKWTTLVVGMMAVSYFSGAFVKNRCERNIKKELQDHLLA